MGAKKYFKKQFQCSMFQLEHHSETDFYTSCWQRNRSALPLLCLRLVIFLTCIGILIASFVTTAQVFPAGKWFIYLTHWGVVMITVTSGFAFAVSCAAYKNGPLEASFSLPWYVKAFWVLYNITITLALFITIYYYALLAGADIEGEFAVNYAIDVLVHTMNSVLMLCLLVTSRVPCRLLHFVFPLCFTLTYLIFTVIYYAAGGLDLLGNTWIYPLVDWSNPGPTLLLLLPTVVFILIVYLLVVGLTAARNAVTKRYKRESRTMKVSNDAA